MQRSSASLGPHGPRPHRIIIIRIQLNFIPDFPVKIQPTITLSLNMQIIIVFPLATYFIAHVTKNKLPHSPQSGISRCIRINEIRYRCSLASISLLIIGDFANSRLRNSGVPTASYATLIAEKLFSLLLASSFWHCCWLLLHDSDNQPNAASNFDPLLLLISYLSHCPSQCTSRFAWTLWSQSWNLISMGT